MPGEFYDPEQHTRAELLQGGFLTRIEDETPEVLKGLHDDVLPAYRHLIEGSKEAERLVTGAREVVTIGAACPEEPLSAILESLPAVEGLESFQGAFERWYGECHLPDSWTHDEALHCLGVWVLYPETESPPPIPDEDWSWVLPLEAEQEERIAEFKKKAESEDLSKDDRRWYRKEQRSLEGELREFRNRMKKEKEGAPQHRWPTLGPPARLDDSEAEPEPRYPLPPPKWTLSTSSTSCGPVTRSVRMKTSNNTRKPSMIERYNLPAVRFNCVDMASHASLVEH